MSSRYADDMEFFTSKEDFEDMAPFLDMSAIEIDEQSLPVFKPDFSTAVVIDNVPVIGAEKFSKLHGAIMKYVKQVAAIPDTDLHLPTDPTTGNTLGFCFVKFATKEDVTQAVKLLDGIAFDKKHTFKVNPYTALDIYGNMSENDAPPAVEFYNEPKVAHWLNDAHARDQFAIRHADETEIFFANPANEEASLVYGGEREKSSGKKWCELQIEWSPQGSYFVTFHKPGVKLWGGPDFSAHAKFMHPLVDEISFSPDELYLVTYKNAESAAHDPNDAIIVWDVRTAAKLKAFSFKNSLDAKYQVKCTVTEEKAGKKVEREVRGRIASVEDIKGNIFYTIDEGNIQHAGVAAKNVIALQEPNKLKWSADGKYLARLAPDVISVYAIEHNPVSLELLDKKSIAAKDVNDFAWSPKANILAYFSPAVGNSPSTINLLQIPSRESICSRKLVDVIEGKLSWQSDGEFLAVYVTKIVNKKKSYVLMIFRVKDPNIPVEIIDCTEPIVNVCWEPSGERVAVVKGDDRYPVVDFYSLAPQAPPKAVKGKAVPQQKTGLVPFYTKSGFQFGELIWSPAGGVIAFVQYASDACIFELFDVQSQTVLANRRHDRGNKVAWDPSGRFFATCTITELRNAHVKGRVEDGVNFYNFQGTVVHQFKKEKLHSFAWRPRWKDLLTPEEKKEVTKNLKGYEKEFEKEDKARKQELNKEIQAARFKLAKEFIDIKNRNRSLCAQLKPLRVAVRDGYDSDDDDNYDVEVIVEEQILKSTEQIVSTKEKGH